MKTMDFSKTIAASYLKASRSIHLIEFMKVSIEGQDHFFTIYFPGFVCFVLYWAKISGERLQDHWSSGLLCCCYMCPSARCGNYISPFLCDNSIWKSFLKYE